MSGASSYFPMVLLAGLMFACETPVPDDQIRPINSTASRGDKTKKATAPKKTKPTTAGTVPGGGAGTTATKPNTTPTTTNTTPTTPTTTTTPSTDTTTTPPTTTTTPSTDTTETTPPPTTTNPPVATQTFVEVDCCIGTQFIACAAPEGAQCADVNVNTDCQADPTFDDLCQ